MRHLPSTPSAAILAAAVTLLLRGAEAAASSCYWPDGSLATGLFVCSANNAESACCGNGDYCTSTGYCLSSSASFYYRSACTDKTWASSSCPKGCLGGTNSNNHSFVNIIACDDRNGLWCCAYDGPCCTNTWQSPPLGQLLLSGGQVTSTVTVSGTAATAASTTTQYSILTATATGSAGSNNAAAVGAGVGVPLGLIALVASSYAIWLRRKMTRSQATSRNDQTHAALYGQPQGQAGEFGSIKQAVAYHPPPVHELEMHQVHEAPGENRDR